MVPVARTLLHYALLLAVTLLLLLPMVPVELAAHGDTTRDLLMAVDCRTGDVCPMAGPDTSFPGVRQSGLWPLHLAVLQNLGISIDGMYAVSFTLLLCGLLLTAGLAEAVAGRTAAFLAASVGLGIHLVAPYWVPLWNPTFILLPAVAMFGALFVAIRSRHWVAWVAAGFFFGLSVALHPIALLCALAFPWAYILAPPRRPLLALMGTVATVILSLYAFFRDALIALFREVQTGALGHSLEATSEQLLSWPMIVGAAVILGALFGGLYWLKNRSRVTADWAVGETAATLLTFLAPAVGAWLVLLGADRFYGFRYLVAPLPGLLAGLALLLYLLGRHLSRPVPPTLLQWAGPLLPILLLLWPAIPVGGRVEAPGTWSYRDGAAVASALGQGGTAHFETALDRLVSPLPLELSYAVRPHLEPGRQPVSPDPKVLAVIPSQTPSDTLPEQWMLRGRPDGSMLFAVELPALLNWEEATARIVHLTAPEADFVPVDIGGYEATFSPWTRPTEDIGDRPGRTLEVRVPVRSDSQRMALAALPDCRCPEGQAEIVHVEGAQTVNAQRTVHFGPSATGWVLARWTYPEPCQAVSFSDVQPAIVAWPSGGDDVARVLAGMVCP